MSKQIDSHEMLKQARILWGDTEDNPEYLRALAELIAYCFPFSFCDTEKAVEIYQNLITAETEDIA